MKKPPDLSSSPSFTSAISSLSSSFFPSQLSSLLRLSSHATSCQISCINPLILANVIDVFSNLFSLKTEYEISPLLFKLIFIFVAPAEIRTVPSMDMGLLMLVFEPLLRTFHSWPWQASIFEQDLHDLFAVCFDITKMLAKTFLPTMPLAVPTTADAQARIQPATMVSNFMEVHSPASSSFNGNQDVSSYFGMEPTWHKTRGLILWLMGCRLAFLLSLSMVSGHKAKAL